MVSEEGTEEAFEENTHSVAPNIYIHLKSYLIIF